MNTAARVPETPRVVDLEPPLDEPTVRALEVGDSVRIQGSVFTGRDRLHRYLFDGGASPVDLQGAVIYHCGPLAILENGRWRVMAAGPTTSMREEPYMARIIAEHSPRLILGKGGMGAATREACRIHGCAYVQLVGGAASWIAQCIKSVENQWFLEEFGPTDAMWHFKVERLTGTVAIDAAGRSVYDGISGASGQRLRQLLNKGGGR